MLSRTVNSKGTRGGLWDSRKLQLCSSTVGDASRVRHEHSSEVISGQIPALLLRVFLEFLWAVPIYSTRHFPIPRRLRVSATRNYHAVFASLTHY